MALRKITISIDAMGGDGAPIVPIEGIKTFTMNHPEKNIFFKIFRDKTILNKLTIGLDKTIFEIIHCESAIGAEEKISSIIRNSKGSSMRAAIESVANKQSDASLSGGNTGALMALSKLILKTSINIDRPAICSIFPTKNDKCVLLDMGANIEINSRNLFEFAIMGHAFAQVVLNKKDPKIALLNIGSEDSKGHSYLKEAADIIRNSFLSKNFIGYIEPNQIYEGKIDVVVTDGFSGNVVIKSAEGLGKLFKNLLKEAFSSNIFSMLGYFLARGSINKTLQIMDPNNYNGGMFIGLNGVSVKSHGGADKYGFAHAIEATVAIVSKRMSEKIAYKLYNLKF